MKKFVWLSIVCVMLAPLLSGCRHFGVKGSGVRKTERRDLPAFKEIDTTGAYEIEVTCQKSAVFEIEADDNILPLIRTKVRGGTLFVRNERSYNSPKAVTLRISLPDLTKVSTHGAGKLRIADVNNDELVIQSTGAAEIEAAGKTRIVELSSTGAGKIDASNLRTPKAVVRVTGAASVEVYASDQLDVTVSGAGHVSYSGDPRVVNKKVSGIGSVDKKGQ